MGADNGQPRYTEPPSEAALSDPTKLSPETLVRIALNLADQFETRFGQGLSPLTDAVRMLAHAILRQEKRAELIANTTDAEGRWRG